LVVVETVAVRLEQLAQAVVILFFQPLLQLVVAEAVHLTTPQAMEDQAVGAVIKVLALLVELEQQIKVETVVTEQQAQDLTVQVAAVHLL
jgi:hypothetical protein